MKFVLIILALLLAFVLFLVLRAVTLKPTAAKEAKKAHELTTANLDKIKGAKNAEELKDVLVGIDEGYKNSMRFINGAKTGRSAMGSFATQAFDNFKKEFSFDNFLSYLATASYAAKTCD